jgi:hypothetical protein
LKGRRDHASKAKPTTTVNPIERSALWVVLSQPEPAQAVSSQSPSSLPQSPEALSQSNGLGIEEVEDEEDETAMQASDSKT